MRPQSIIAIVLALVLGGSAAFLVRQYVTRRATPQAETVSVVAAAMLIPRGMLITPDLIKTHDYPKDLVPTGALLKKEDALDRSAFTSMVIGEPLLETKLSPKGQRGLASLIAPGMRAFTITTNLTSGVAGFILPGNKVDVLMTVSGAGTNDLTGGGSTITLLQNVEILAVDQKVEAPADNKIDSTNLRSFTLLVTHNQAARLSLGQNKGTLHLTLRNPTDQLATNVRPTTVNDIQSLSEAPSRPWDERAKDLLKAWSDARAKAPPAPLPQPHSPPSEAMAAPRKFIRTIRGSSEGMVSLTPLGSG